MRLAPFLWTVPVLLEATTLAPELLAQELPVAPAGATGRAIEIGIGGGFTDGWGNLTSASPPAVRLPGAGGQLELDAGLRVLPSLAVGAYGFGAQLSETAALPTTADVFQAGAGLQGTLHFRPSATDADPWLSLGAGWRGQWLTYVGDHGFTAQNGIDMLRARVGLDMRVSPTLALSPVLGVSLSTFVTQSVLGSPWSSTGPFLLDTFVFAGVRATIDLPLERRPGRPTVASP